MIDIIDVILGKSLSSSGRLEYYAAKAQKAAQDAATAVDNIDSITEQTNTNNTAAAEALEQANQALENVTEALNNLDEGTVTEEDIRDEIDNLLFSLTTNVNDTAIYKNLVISYPSDEEEILNNIIIMYQQQGQNTNGTMTQKAITDYVNSIESSLIQRINNIPTGGGSGSGSGTSNLGADNAGHIVVIGDNGDVIAGETLESDVIAALIKTNSYSARSAVGIEVDYENKTTKRSQEAENYTIGADFAKYDMYGGRMRCNVADDGTINAFYGDSQYRDDGSNGQVMIYQPKFYYQRLPIKTKDTNRGTAIQKESLILSSTKQPNFKIHPLFVAADGSELDYVLLSAYESCAYDVSASAYDLTDSDSIDFTTDKLSSIAGVKPITGGNKEFTITTAEQMANNRGSGWHVTNMAAESAIQMLEVVEFGSLNGQQALNRGIDSINSSGANYSNNTGSTASLGNNSGVATSTVNNTDGITQTYSTDGKRAISYRGMENPWGNTWHMIAGINISGDGDSDGGIPYICTDFNYASTVTGDNYIQLPLQLPTSYSYISSFGYCGDNYDWIYWPLECFGGNSAVPVGDYIWTTNQLNGINRLACGGSWQFGDRNGIFAYGLDQGINRYSSSGSARLMYIPTKNNIYSSNITKWRSKRGG